MPAQHYQGEHRSMEQLAEDVQLLAGFPQYAINVYLLGDVLVDAGTRWTGRTILRQTRRRKLASHALTHVHPDHQGSSHAVCEALGIPLWCGEADAAAMENHGEMLARMPRNGLNRVVGPIFAGPPHRVSRRLKEGDPVGTFTVIETPGHTDGHISFCAKPTASSCWAMFSPTCLSCPAGPACANHRLIFLAIRPRTVDLVRLMELEPKLVCFGHGPPLRETRRFIGFIENLAGS